MYSFVEKWRWDPRPEPPACGRPSLRYCWCCNYGTERDWRPSVLCPSTISKLWRVKTCVLSARTALAVRWRCTTTSLSATGPFWKTRRRALNSVFMRWSRSRPLKMANGWWTWVQFNAYHNFYLMFDIILLCMHAWRRRESDLIIYCGIVNIYIIISCCSFHVMPS